MPATCPRCGSRFLRVSHAQSWRQWLDLVGFSRHLRCGDCRTRFVADTFYWRDLFFARCPQCERMDLNHWLDERLQARGWMAFKMMLGGHRLRCEYCRINFVSLRRKKEHFSFRRWMNRRKREGAG